MGSHWRLINTRNGLPVATELEVADGLLSRLIGLQFRESLPRGCGMLLVPCAAVHTYFVRFPIDVVQLDGRGRVVVVRRDVRSWRTVEPSPWTRAVLELPAGAADVAIGDVLRLRSVGLDAREPPDSLLFLTDHGLEMPPAAAPWRFLLLLGLVGLMAYVNSLPAPFTRPAPSRPLDAPPPRNETVWGGSVNDRWPVALTLSLNYAVGRLRPGGYHAFNLAVHVLAALTLFGIVRRTLISPRAPPRLRGLAAWLAFVVALLWLVHPLQTQTVTPVLNRGDLMSGLFGLLALYFTLRGAEVTRGLGWYVGAVLFCALAAFCSDGPSPIPLILLAYDRAFLASSWSVVLRRRGPLHAALAIAALVLAPAAPIATRFEQLPLITPWDYARTQPGVVLHYLSLTLWPHPLNGDCADWPTANGVTALLSGIVVLTLLACTAWALWRRPQLGFLGLCFFLLLAPTSSFLPRSDLAAEQRMYLALAPLVVLVVLTVEAATAWIGTHFRLADPVRSAILGAFAVVVWGTFSTLTVLRNDLHCNPRALLEETVDQRPRNFRAWSRLGDDHHASGEFVQAEECYREALRLRPGWLPARHHLGVLLLQRRRIAEAVEVLGAPSAEGSDGERVVWYLTRLGLAFWAAGDPGQAAASFREAVRLEPTNASHHFSLALMLHEHGKSGDPDAVLREAIQLDPDYPEKARRWAWDAVATTDVRQRFAVEGLLLVRKAMLVRGERPETLETLAVVLAESGRYAEALQAAEKGIQAAESVGWSATAARLREQVILYRRQQPVHP